jgi:hypothetical protein
MAAQFRLLSAGRLEEAGGIERRVPQELPHFSMEPVRAAPVHDVDRRASRPAVLGADVVRQNLELADRVRRRLHHLVREPLVARAVSVVVHSVDQEVVERAPQAVDVERSFARCSAARVQRRQADARGPERERRILPPVERNGGDLVCGDDLAPLARVGIEQRYRRGHLHLLGELPDRHLHVDTESRAHLHDDVVNRGNGQSRLLRGEDVETGPDGEEFVDAFTVGLTRDGDAGLGVRQRDGRCGNGGAEGVSHRADDRGRLELCGSGCGEGEGECGRERECSEHDAPYQPPVNSASRRNQFNVTALRLDAASSVAAEIVAGPPRIRREAVTRG